MDEPEDIPTTVDPELRRQLDTADAEDLVDAVFVLELTPEPPALQEVEQTVRDIVARITSESGHPVVELNVLANLSSFVVRATPDVLEELIAQPEVGSAIANHQTEEETT